MGPDGKQLLSWSHDGTLRLWDMESGRESARLKGHESRITAAGLTSDSQWAVSGASDGTVKLWDLRQKTEAHSVRLKDEVRGCWCLLDGESVVTASADGWIVLWSLPDFEVRAEFASGIKVMCGELSPSGNEIALGSADGFIHLLTIEGIEDSPIRVIPRQTLKPQAGVIGRFLGQQRLRPAYQYTCPACRHTSEVASLPSAPIPCPSCKRLLRLNADVLQLQPQ